MPSRFRQRLDDAILGGLTGAFFGVLYASWVVLLMLLNGSVLVRMRHGAMLHGGGAITAFVLTGVLAGVVMSQLRTAMTKSRVFAFILGAGFGVLLCAGLVRSLSGVDRSRLDSFLAAAVVGIGLGGYTGLQVRKGMLAD